MKRGRPFKDRSNLNAMENLTPQEQKLCELIAQGEDNFYIAVSLGIQPPTMKRHLSNVFDKLGFENRTQVARWWIHETEIKPLQESLRQAVILVHEHQDWFFTRDHAKAFAGKIAELQADAKIKQEKC